MRDLATGRSLCFSAWYFKFENWKRATERKFLVVKMIIDYINFKINYRDLSFKYSN